MFAFLDRKKRWANWSRAEKSALPEILEFLIPVEHSSMSITSRLMSRGLPDSELLSRQEIYLEIKDRRIVSLLMFSNDSVISPVFTAESSSGVPAELLKQSALHRKKYLTLMGTKEDILRIESIMAKRNMISIDYHQLTAVSSRIPAIVSDYLGTKPEFSNLSLKIRRAVPSELEKLMPLRKAYEIEEVLLDQSHFSEQACRNRFRKTIKDKHVFYAASGSGPVATCCINSGGLGWYQIGGVYTRPALRSRGISAALMAETAAEAARDGKNLTLFVKKTNKPALKLYQNCGFGNTGEFRITYAERR